MVQVKEIVVGERYEVQPKNFHRGVIGTVTRVENGSILLKVENYDICDRGKVNAEASEPTYDWSPQRTGCETSTASLQLLHVYA
jgi:hypothetical protein